MNGNVFEDFAEDYGVGRCSGKLQFKRTIRNAAVKKLAAEAYGDAYKQIRTFLDAVLLTIVSALGVRTGMIEISSGVDMRDQRPILFVDEDRLRFVDR